MSPPFRLILVMSAFVIGTFIVAELNPVVPLIWGAVVGWNSGRLYRWITQPERNTDTSPLS